MNQSQDKLRAKIEEISNLPTLPEMAERLMRTINNPKSSARDVTLELSHDQSLSAKVLRLANSAFYGIPRAISNVQNAVVILGSKVIYSIVLSLTVFEMFPKGKSLFNRHEFWKHAICCATFSKLLALQARRRILFDPEEAFCAGLLHDIGRVVLEQYLHDDFERVLLYTKKREISLLRGEREVLGFDHTEIGKWLIARWNLPDSLIFPIIFHHQPSLSKEAKEVVAMVHLADQLCYEMGLVITDFPFSPPRERGAEELLQLSEIDFDQAKRSTEAELDKIDEFVSLATK